MICTALQNPIYLIFFPFLHSFAAMIYFEYEVWDVLFIYNLCTYTHICIKLTATASPTCTFIFLLTQPQDAVTRLRSKIYIKENQSSAIKLTLHDLFVELFLNVTWCVWLTARPAYRLADVGTCTTHILF